MKNEITKYISGICQDKKRAEQISWWIDTHWDKIKNEPQSDIEHVIDYLAQNNKKLNRATYPQMKKEGEKWTKALQKKGKDIDEVIGKDVKVLKDFGDGFKVVELISENSFKREGFLMRHCVSSFFGKATKIYSLRDENNMPHATFEKGLQIKGKGNGPINPKYVKYVVDWLELTGCEVRDSEMENLGYYNVESVEIKIPKNLLFKDKYMFVGDLNKLEDKNHLSLVDIFGWFEINDKMKVNYNFDLRDAFENMKANILKQKNNNTIERYANIVAEYGSRIVAEYDANIMADQFTDIVTGSFSKIVAENYLDIVAQNGSKIVAKNRANIMVEDGSKILAEDFGNIVARYHSKIVAENGANIEVGCSSKTVAENGSKIVAENCSKIVTGSFSKIVAENYLDIVAQNGSKIVTGKRANIVAENSSKIVAKDGGNIVAGADSDIVAEHDTDIVAGNRANIVAKCFSKIVAEHDTKIVAGNCAKIVAENYLDIVAQNGSKIVAKNRANIVAKDNTRIVAGEDSAVSVGKNSLTALGKNSKIKGCLFAWLTIVEYLDSPDENGNIIKTIHSFQIDGEKYKPDTYYTIKNGKIVKAE